MAMGFVNGDGTAAVRRRPSSVWAMWGDVAGGGTRLEECPGVSTVPACICSDVPLRRTVDGGTIGASRFVTVGDRLDRRDVAAVTAKDFGFVEAAVTE